MTLGPMLKISSQISLRHFLLLVLLVGSAIGMAGSYWRASVYQPMRITATWSGKVPNEAARKTLLARARDSQGGEMDPLDWLDDEFPKIADPLNAPDIGLVRDAETWETIWKAWHGGDAPQIDFEREFVIVVKGEGPNQISCWSEPTRNGAGDAKMELMVTLMGGPGFCYLFLQTPRPEIQSIHGKPVPTIDYRATKK
jgi:hypothetical protein